MFADGSARHKSAELSSSRVTAVRVDEAAWREAGVASGQIRLHVSALEAVDFTGMLGTNPCSCNEAKFASKEPLVNVSRLAPSELLTRNLDPMFAGFNIHRADFCAG